MGGEESEERMTWRLRKQRGQRVWAIEKRCSPHAVKGGWHRLGEIRSHDVGVEMFVWVGLGGRNGPWFGEREECLAHFIGTMELRKQNLKGGAK